MIRNFKNFRNLKLDQSQISQLNLNLTASEHRAASVYIRYTNVIKCVHTLCLWFPKHPWLSPISLREAFWKLNGMAKDKFDHGQVTRHEQYPSVQYTRAASAVLWRKAKSDVSSKRARHCTPRCGSRAPWRRPVLLRLQSSSNLGSLKETADHYSSEQSTSICRIFNMDKLTSHGYSSPWPPQYTSRTISPRAFSRPQHHVSGNVSTGSDIFPKWVANIC